MKLVNLQVVEESSTMGRDWGNVSPSMTETTRSAKKEGYFHVAPVRFSVHMVVFFNYVLVFLL